MPSFSNIILALLPLAPSAYLFHCLKDDAVKRQLIISFAIGICAYALTATLVPVIAEYTKRKGLSGKDLCKKGMENENRDIPEALGIVPGSVFLTAAITSQLIFADNAEELTIFNSALFSICFMIFLGYTDDTLDLKWRYKLILPTVASLPLLVSYSGSTAVYIPAVFRSLLMQEGQLTQLGKIIDVFAVVDTEAFGAIIELKHLFLVFMGMLAVFCTNAINILAGINGLECGQSYVIAASILFFKLYDVLNGKVGDHQLFSLIMIIPFIGTALGLLKHNWYPSAVFVGDTFCYFAGMTFAVIGIHGHFSKTLLLLFIPQIFNFVYSIPQLFKIMPCPRHRLPKINPSTGLLQCSTFPCAKEEFRWLKVNADDTECPNCTLICFVLRITGPLNEMVLCLTLLSIQIAFSAVAFYVRYVMLEESQSLGL